MSEHTDIIDLNKLWNRAEAESATSASVDPLIMLALIRRIRCLESVLRMSAVVVERHSDDLSVLADDMREEAAKPVTL